MEDKDKTIPSSNQVRQIFNETYNKFYRKWKDISDPADWPKLMQEMHEIDDKYQCELCSKILLELVVVIQNEFLKKQGGV